MVSNNIGSNTTRLQMVLEGHAVEHRKSVDDDDDDDDDDHDHVDNVDDVDYDDCGDGDDLAL